MIHLDTNILIALPLLARTGHSLARRIGEAAATCSLAWFEYLCGPVDETEQQLTRAALGGRIVGVDEAMAERAAVLFNAVGRRRQTRTGSLIAACAIMRTRNSLPSIRRTSGRS